MIKFVLFDFANTLVYKPNVFNIFQVFIKKNFSQEIDLREIQAAHDELREKIVFPDKTTEEFYLDFNAKVLRLLGIDDIDESILKNLFQDLRALEWQAFDDSEYLESLDLPKAVLSNWDECLGDYVNKLTPYEFEFVMGSYTTGFSKPNPKFFQTAIDKIKAGRDIENENILMVGDSPQLDIEPALRLGMKAALIDRYDNFNNIGDEGIIIDSLRKIPQVLEKFLKESK